MRSNPLYYINPSAISLTPNCNGSHNDIAVYISSGTKIKVYNKDIPGLDISSDTNSYREWTLTGRNRRLGDADGTTPFTIYARIQKSGTDAYLVFAKKVQRGDKLRDKYPYVTTDGMANVGLSNQEIAQMATILSTYWYIKLGEVSAAQSSERTITLDTGILGTDQYNNKWQPEPDKQPLRVVIANTKDSGTPYLQWGDSITLTASLIRGWETDAGDLVDRWTITRDTGNATADAAWNANHSLDSNRQITLSHATDGDDLNHADAATFAITAWGGDDSSDSSSSEEPAPLAVCTITIYAEANERNYYIDTTIDHITIPSGEQSATFRIAGHIYRRRFGTTDEPFACPFAITRRRNGERTIILRSASPVSSFSEYESEASVGDIIEVFIWESSDTIDQAFSTYLCKKEIPVICDGDPGPDGNGYEYVYMRAKVETAPLLDETITDSHGRTRLDDDYLPGLSSSSTAADYASSEFTNNPIGVSETWPCEYQAVRKKVNGAWQPFSEATLHRTFSESPYVASLDTEMGILHVTGNGKPTRQQTLSVTPSLRKGEQTLTPSISVKRNGTTMTPGTASGGVTVSMTLGTLVIAYATTARCTDGTDRFTITISHKVDGVTKFSEDKVLTVMADGRDLYTLLPSPSQILVQRTTGSFMPSVFSVACGYQKTDIDGQTVQVQDVTGQIDGLYNLYYRRHQREIAWESTYRLYADEGSSSDSSDSSSSSSDSSGSTDLTSLSASEWDAVEFILCKNTAESVAPASVTGQAAGITVPVLTNGSVGATGPSYYYLGEWKDQDDSEYIPDGTTIQTTGYERPFISYTNGGSTQYYLYIGERATTAPGTRYNPYDQPTLWEMMQSQNKYIISKAIFAKFANFGGAIFNIDWMMSTNGKVANTNFQSGELLTVKTLGGANASIRPYTLFDPQKPTSDGTTAYEDELSGESARVLKKESTHQYDLLTNVTLEAGKTYYIKTDGQTSPNSNASYTHKGKVCVRVKNGSTSLDVTDLISDIYGGKKISFFRVSETGNYTIDVYEIPYNDDPGSADEYFNLWLYSWSYGECSFAPNYAVDLLTGMAVQGYGFSSGAVRRNKVIIDDSSFDYYTKPSIADPNRRYLNLDMCGSFIEIRKQIHPLLQLPVLCAGGTKIVISGGNSVEVPMTEEDRDYARSFVGTKILIYVKHGGIDSYFTKQHESSIYSDQFYCKLSKDTEDGEPTYKVESISDGQFVELECCTGVDISGNEIVYWKVNAKGNMA